MSSDQVQRTMRYLRHCIWVLAGLLIVAALTVRLESVPPPWWDEGWTLSVAGIGRRSGTMVACWWTTCAKRHRRGISRYRGRRPSLAFRRRYCSGANGRSRYHDSDSGFNVPSGPAHLQSIHCFRLSVRDDAIARVYRPFSTLHRQTSFGRNACNVFSTCRLYSYAICAAPPHMGAVLGCHMLGICTDHETASSPVLDVLTDGFFRWSRCIGVTGNHSHSG